MEIILGVLGFVAFYIYEVNQIVWQTKTLKSSFVVGCCLIIISTTLTAINANIVLTLSSLVTWIGIVGALFFAVLLLYTLFFAIPFVESYVDQFEKRYVYTDKVYSLCRHPGVLWFIGLYGTLVILFPTSQMIYLSLILVLMNLGYILLQDVWSFPRLFSDYETYKKSTPFLIPSIQSMTKTIKSYKRR